jgi:hypothetical protein
LNNIENIDEFINSCFKQGFDIKKYGYLRQEKTPEPIQTIIVQDCSEKDEKIKMLQETLAKLRKEIIDLKTNQ